MSSSTISWSRRARTLIARSTWLLRSWSSQTIAYLAGSFVLGLIVLSDLRRSRRLQSKTPTPPFRRKLPIPIREGSQIIAVMPDGERVPVDSLAAVTHAKAWQEVVGGALVYQMTKPPSDGSGS